eukprot:TRINITY_DN6100_c0_g1_i3.p1 TRINITY_DN6100_c0_g1~~TRINITY_DN6100_c0_g1_i3.p1  ORF type:complete len:115 (-),score=15.22 TRINITY_DN6100_c0_g1_i3:515-859(-)
MLVSSSPVNKSSTIKFLSDTFAPTAMTQTKSSTASDDPKMLFRYVLPLEEPSMPPIPTTHPAVEQLHWPKEPRPKIVLKSADQSYAAALGRRLVHPTLADGSRGLYEQVAQQPE